MSKKKGKYFDINFKIKGTKEKFTLKVDTHPKAFTQKLKVGRLKSIIQLEKDLYGMEIELEFDGEKLQNKKTLGDYGIKKGSEITLQLPVATKKADGKKKKQSLVLLTESENDSILELIKQIAVYKGLSKQLTDYINDKDFYQKMLEKTLDNKIGIIVQAIEDREKDLKKTIKQLVLQRKQKSKSGSVSSLQGDLKKETKILKGIYSSCLSVMKAKTLREVAFPKADGGDDSDEDTRRDPDGDEDAKEDAGGAQEASIPDLVDEALGKVDETLKSEVYDVTGGNQGIVNDADDFKDQLGDLLNVEDSSSGTSALPKIAQPGLGYKTVFQSFRSNGGLKSSYYIRWNIKGLNNCGRDILVDNSHDDSEFIVKKKGLYRIISRHVSSSSSTYYSAIYINGTNKCQAYRYCYSGPYDISYIFNEIFELNENDKIRIYNSQCSQKNESKSSYFCIERIPKLQVSEINSWESSTNYSNYRSWNVPVKSGTNCESNTSNGQIKIKKAGLYRICARLHTNYSSRGSRYYYLEKYHDGSAQYFYNYQASYNTNYCNHNFSQIMYFSRKDYFRFYYGGYGNWSSSVAQRFYIERLPFRNFVGSWKSTSNVSNRTKWSFPQYESSGLYVLSDDETYITVTKSGFYRISFGVTNSVNGNAYAALYVNEREYSVVRMGTYSGTYYCTLSLYEIVQLKKNDKINVYQQTQYASRDYNTLNIEKLVA